MRSNCTAIEIETDPECFRPTECEFAGINEKGCAFLVDIGLKCVFNEKCFSATNLVECHQALTME